MFLFEFVLAGSSFSVWIWVTRNVGGVFMSEGKTELGFWMVAFFNWFFFVFGKDGCLGWLGVGKMSHGEDLLKKLFSESFILSIFFVFSV